MLKLTAILLVLGLIYVPTAEALFRLNPFSKELDQVLSSEEINQDEVVDTLREILFELKALNQYMSSITGDEILASNYDE